MHDQKQIEAYEKTSKKFVPEEEPEEIRGLTKRDGSETESKA